MAPPTAITGFTRDEIISQLQDTVGNSSSSFQSALTTNITAWLYQFCKLADWSWLYKNGVANSLSFSTANGTSAYTMNTVTCGFELNATNIESIYSQTTGKKRKLIKLELNDLRTGDPGQDSTGDPYFWSPYGRQGIVLYPTPTTTETLYIDGKVHGAELTTNVTLPVPYECQELFFQFCLTKALRRERDPRSKEELAIFGQMLKLEIAANMNEIESSLRFKTVNEALGNANPQDLNSRIWNYGE